MVELTVPTPDGDVRGVAVSPGMSVFAGIPFAAPPLGPLRLRPPAPVEPWSGVRAATVFPPAPMQGRPALASRDASVPRVTNPLLAKLAAAAPGRPSDVSEDCLFLNVWAPTSPGPHPVVVWIYGGGFDAGSASPPMTDGAALAETLDAVVVAVDYRLGALGFLHLSDLGGSDWAGSTNLGLQDQAAALRWVRRSIAAFGGDDRNITVAGQSAGAFSIGSLLAMPAAVGTFDKAILQSGSTGRVFDAATATAIAEDFLRAAGVADVDGLLSLPAARFTELQNSVIDTDIGRRNTPGGRSWGSVLDGVVLPNDPQRWVEQGRVRGIPLLIGADRDEVRVFQVVQGAAFQPADDTAVRHEMARAGVDARAAFDGYSAREGDDLASVRSAFLTDAIYRVPAVRLARAQAAAGGTAFSYLVGAEPLGPELGAFHGSELAHLFGGVAGTDPVAGIELVAAWRAFAHDGDPGWKPHTTELRDTVRRFGGGAPMVVEPPDDPAGRVWHR